MCMGRVPEELVKRSGRPWYHHGVGDARKAKAALGIRLNDPLPRCPAKSRKKARALRDAGDTSHLGRSHVCPECRCEHVAGMGTSHYGVGYCWYHEGGVMTSRARVAAVNQKHAIQQGYPDEPWVYLSHDKYLEKVRESACEAKAFLSLKEEMLLLKTSLQKLVDSWSDRGTFTESYRGTEVPASDRTKAEVLAKLVDGVGKLAKIQLDVTSEEYVHVAEVKMWIGEFIRIIESVVSEEQFGDIVEQIKKVPQPMPGKRG